jgi:dihydroflavonol-4-reductase
MILVTGATGHIGNVLVRALLARDQAVRALLLPGEDSRPLEGLDVELVEGDVLGLDSLRAAMNDVQVVYHLAGVISIKNGEDLLLQQVNIQGTKNVLQAAREAGVRRLVYTSSIHAIARAPHGTTIDESIPFDPQGAISAYDRSKAEASLAVLQAVKDGMDAVIVCPTGVIGPFDFHGSEMGRLIYDSMLSPVQWCLEGAYDFVDVRDVATGHILACEKGLPGECYLLSGEQISLIHLMDNIVQAAGPHKHLLKIKVPLWLARFTAQLTPLYYQITRSKPRLTRYALETLASNSLISHAKAGRELGYKPRSLRESIADTVQWLRENGRPWAAVEVTQPRK